MLQGFVYLVAIMDYSSRLVLTWEISHLPSWVPHSVSRPWSKPLSYPQPRSVENLWRPVKYEDVTFCYYQKVSEVRNGVATYVL